MGLNSGEVVVGRIGDDLRMDSPALGQTVGLAARMEQLAEPGRIYLTQHTERFIRGYFQVRALGPLAVKGVTEPIHVFDLEDAGRFGTRLEVARAAGLTRFVGRGPELDVLETALERARAGEGEVVGVVGEAGVGKSRLCLEFVERARRRGVPVWDAHCPAHGRALPYLPILQLLRAYFGIGERDAPAEARRKIAGALLLPDEALAGTLRTRPASSSTRSSARRSRSNRSSRQSPSAPGGIPSSPRSWSSRSPRRGTSRVRRGATASSRPRSESPFQRPCRAFSPPG